MLKKQGPFLKMYSEYTNNYKRATQTFEECIRKKKHFEELVRRLEVRKLKFILKIFLAYTRM